MTRQKDACFRVIHKRSSDLCASRPRASVYWIRCVGSTIGSVKKVRRLSENSENLQTKRDAGQIHLLQ